MYDFFFFLCIFLLLSRIFYNTTYSARQLMCSKVKHSPLRSLFYAISSVVPDVAASTFVIEGSSAGS